ncbi:alpha/beta-hydrolase [Hymenopellis radicata]|nr:alpha/beta-hydrolase [Hymenopellis radicata]
MTLTSTVSATTKADAMGSSRGGESAPIFLDECIACVRRILPAESPLSIMIFAAWHVLYHVVTTSSPKPWRRTACETIARFTTKRFPLFAPQYLLKSSVHVYEHWARQHRLPRTIEVLPDDARLMWIGPKCLDNVILFIHGGGFVYPMSDFAHTFLLHIKTEIQKIRGIHVGVCTLAYNLIPTGRFPSQLRDAHAAVDFLFQLGVKPGNLQLLGESAGGTIALQLLRHVHHPHPAVEPFAPDTRFAGVCIISPGVPYRDGDDGESKNDLISLRTLKKFSALLTYDVLERVMLTSGTEELMARAHARLRDELLRCQDVDLTWIVDEGGLHCGPVFDFPMGILPGKPYIGEVTNKVVRWLMDGFDTLLEV